MKKHYSVAVPVHGSPGAESWEGVIAHNAHFESGALIFVNDCGDVVLAKASGQWLAMHVEDE